MKNMSKRKVKCKKNRNLLKIRRIIIWQNNKLISSQVMYSNNMKINYFLKEIRGENDDNDDLANNNKKDIDK